MFSPTWAPDGSHLFTQVDYQVRVFDHAGSRLAALNFDIDTMWLDDQTVEAYGAGSLPQMTTPDADGLDQFYTVSGQLVDLSGLAPAGAQLPCCYPRV